MKGIWNWQMKLSHRTRLIKYQVMVLRLGLMGSNKLSLEYGPHSLIFAFLLMT
jgi:hypothetical protein